MNDDEAIALGELMKLNPDPIAEVKAAGSRYTEEEIDEAYLMWRDDPKHVMSRVAKKYEVAPETVRRWAARYNWRDRLVEYNKKSISASGQYLKLLASEVVEDAITRLQQIIMTGEDKDAVQAIKVLFSAVNPNAPQIDINTDNRRVVVNGLDIKNPEDVYRALAQSAQGNITDKESRRSRGR